MGVVLATGLLVPGMGNADLIARNGGTMIYDTDLDITWLADANYAKTSGYDADGLMMWNDANTFASTVNIDGYTGWRLPSSSMIDSTCSNLSDINGSAYNFGVNCTGSELGHLFYDELGGGAWMGIHDHTDTDHSLELFTNLYGGHYWSTLIPVDDYLAESFHFHFDANGGFQRHHEINNTFAVWLVHDGDIAGVPEPDTLMLMSIGLLLTGWSMRKKQRA